MRQALRHSASTALIAFSLFLSIGKGLWLWLDSTRLLPAGCSIVVLFKFASLYLFAFLLAVVD
ncbi:MAG: hypothetical protein DRO52_03640 [Candidatus Hecatellales archaeon]|nr:MAG: hypothetical protein DRO52_03640 [Candidatus Hecatellales archaeon]